MFISLSKERGVRARGYNLEVDYHLLSILLPRGGRPETSRPPPAHTPFLHTLMRNQKRMLMQAGRGPLEQVASQGFLSERACLGSGLGFCWLSLGRPCCPSGPSC